MADKKDGLNDLRTAAERKQVASDRDAIKSGRTVWYRGRPAAAESGTVAIDIESGGRIIIDEKDVRSVIKEDVQFLVEVDSNADVLVRFEGVVKAEDPKKGGCCGEKSPEPPESIAQRYGNVLCIGGIEWVCTWYIGVNGWPIRICYPVWNECHRLFPIVSRYPMH